VRAGTSETPPSPFPSPASARQPTPHALTTSALLPTTRDSASSSCPPAAGKPWPLHIHLPTEETSRLIGHIPYPTSDIRLPTSHITPLFHPPTSPAPAPWWAPSAACVRGAGHFDQWRVIRSILEAPMKHIFSTLHIAHCTLHIAHCTLHVARLARGCPLRAWPGRGREKTAGT
jgi:hypothetical protein